MKEKPMSDLIERAAAIQVARDTDYIGLYVGDVKKVTDEVIKGIKAIPIAEPKVGRWIMHIDDLFPEESTQECSICHEHQYILNDDNYCPNCGAKMEGST